jgi:hypothetical protein
MVPCGRLRSPAPLRAMSRRVVHQQRASIGARSAATYPEGAARRRGGTHCMGCHLTLLMPPTTVLSLGTRW